MLTKYSLWFYPPKDIKDKLDRQIAILAKKYDGPVFESHLTLLGGIFLDKKH